MQLEKPPTGFSRLRIRARGITEERAIEGRKTAYRRALTDLWKRRWQQESSKTGRSATTWLDDWTEQPLQLYNDLPKHEATALFLLRTEVLGLNDWLARIGVPGVTPMCPCGTGKHTIRHLLAFCPEQVQPRANLLLRTGTTELREILTNKKMVKATAQWLLKTNTLEQFRIAKEIAYEKIGDWAPFKYT